VTLIPLLFGIGEARQPFADVSQLIFPGRSGSLPCECTPVRAGSGEGVAERILRASAATSCSPPGVVRATGFDRPNNQRCNECQSWGRSLPRSSSISSLADNAVGTGFLMLFHLSRLWDRWKCQDFSSRHQHGRLPTVEIWGARGRAENERRLL